MPTDTTATPTPDNTPVPGGGSWHWDYAQARWVSNDAAAPITETPQE